MSEKKQLRKKPEVLDSLSRIVTPSDTSYVNNLYPSYGNLVKNGFANEDNPATYIGWGKLEDGTILRIEGEPRESDRGNTSVAMKIVSIPAAEAVRLGLSEPKIPKYKSKETDNFLDQ